MREPAEPDTFEQSMLSKRMSRKRKAPADEEVCYILLFYNLFTLHFYTVTDIGDKTTQIS